MLDKNIIAIEDKQNKQNSLYMWLFALYFLLAPMEDLLTGPVGTVGRYLAILIVFIGFAETRKNGLILKMDVKNTCMILLMLLTILSVVWSANLDITMGRFQPYLLLPSLCIFTSMLSIREKDFNRIVVASILGSVITAIYTLYLGSTITVYGRVTLNDYNDPNNLAALFILPATLVWNSIMKYRGMRRILFIAIFGILAFCILMTGSRGGFLSLLIMIFSYLAFSRAFKHIYVLLIIFFIAVLFIWFLPNMLPIALRQRMFMVENYTAGGARGDLWKIAVYKILPDVGVLGFGAGTAGIKMQEVLGYYKGIHNTYLTMIVEFGFLGIPVFLTMLISLLRQKIKQEYYTGAAMLVGICVSILFLDSYAKKFFWNVILLLIIHGQLEENKLKINYQ